MKVFYHATANENQQKNNELFYRFLEDLGHKHTTDWIVKHKQNDMSDPKVRKQAKKLLDNQEFAIKKSDVVIFNANVPSVGTGIFMHIATQLSKPVIALCERRDNIPFLYEALDYNKLMIVECDETNYQKVLPRALSKAEKIIDKRFTLLLPPDVVEMLDNHYERTGETRSEYIRNLIKEDQAKRALQPPPRYLAPSE